MCTFFWDFYSNIFRNRCCRPEIFFRKSCPETLLKRDPGICILLPILWNFEEHLIIVGTPLYKKKRGGGIFRNLFKITLSKVIFLSVCGVCVLLFYTISISILLEAVAWRCPVKKVFLEILQNSQGKTCARDSNTGVFFWILWNF